MRHNTAHRKLGRSPSHRRAMLRNMATSLLMSERCHTTLPKAKEIRPVVEKLISLGREDSLAHRRKAYAYLQNKEIVHKLFAEIGPRYKSRPGGYTRVLRTSVRPGDKAQMALVELVQEELKAKKKTQRKKTASKKGESTKKAAAPKKAASEKKDAPAVEAEGASEETSKE